MSRAVWNTTQLASRELNLMSLSCSAGSLSAIKPALRDRSQAPDPL